MEIGKRLKALRKSLKLTQKGLAEKIRGKIDYTYIGKIERGEQNPSLKMLKKISDTFNIDIEYFFSNKPLEHYFNKEKRLSKAEYILNLLLELDEKDLKFLIEIIKLLVKYNKIKPPSIYKIEPRKNLLKVADK